MTDFGDKVKPLKELPKRKAFAFLQTVRQNMEGFTRHKVKGANLARKAQAILGHPTSKELSQVVSRNFCINNNPINPIDVSNADVIYGPDLGKVRGKTARKNLNVSMGRHSVYRGTSISCTTLLHLLRMLCLLMGFHF